MFSSVQLTVEANRHLPVPVIVHLDRDQDPDLDQGEVGLVLCLVQVVLPHQGLDLLQYLEDMDPLVFSIEEGLQGKF